MPKIALEKVSKKIRKKKGALDGLGDRNAARMNRASLRDQKLKHAAKVRNIQKEHEMLRIGYFKVVTKGVTEPLSIEKTRDLIAQWVSREETELERYELERRAGRPPLPKYLELKNKVEREREEFRTGYLMPDLQDMVNIVNLQRWDGTTGSLAQVKFTRVSKEDPPVVEDKMET
ncbi:translation machinery-associated protein 16 [Tricharina praecox]|uniref:translation machinery-associated protein 16 n=1 Tax=Tricharina praecox TaxID=43433 RepID=UPI002220C713|nr:translation machinery-associated protein 16 [Tricharina praecox]XP_051343659.1 translation machinery-associated protein 16 [Tricharina praecox]KAI5841287.1 translation machinery-associated protein 16 [Tricharina praecox]KAI5857913.1 translation machinery-associated protein 16 [Tricharina praecox]